MDNVYHFHLVSSERTVEDKSGTRLSGPDEARLQAVFIAAELAREGARYRGFLVCVADDTGNEIIRVPIASDVSGGL